MPDSGSLILLGFTIGFIVRETKCPYYPFVLNSDIFFRYILPPIILDAGYFMPSKYVFKNLATLTLLSVVGTLLNAISIGLFLHVLSDVNAFDNGFPISVHEMLTFSSLISAVDPVAVLALFEEVQVSPLMYITVFGESVFNDGISVALYDIFHQFSIIKIENIREEYYGQALSLFPLIVLGGLTIGIVFGFIVSWLTKHSFKVKILNPFFILIFPYLAYLTSETVGYSSILSVVGCSMFMKQYVGENIGRNASTSVKYFIKTMAHLSESLAYIYIGTSTVLMKNKIKWDYKFIICTIFICFLSRVVFIFLQTYFVNIFRKRKYSLKQQLVLLYCGLRGCISFGMIQTMDEKIEAKKMFVGGVLAEIFFCVFFQGVTIRGLVYLLKIEPDEENLEVEEYDSSSYYGNFKRYFLDPLLKRYDGKGVYIQNKQTISHVNLMNFKDISQIDDNRKEGCLNIKMCNIRNLFKRGNKDTINNEKIKKSSIHYNEDVKANEVFNKVHNIVEFYISDPVLKKEMCKKVVGLLEEEGSHDSDIEDDSILELKKRISKTESCQSF
uniref:Sodium/hydrogen exchanger n=1 Tax=Parastrongyloides trichosuri TaxID=131310 RepID=A0A0N4ZVU5_PARTI